MAVTVGPVSRWAVNRPWQAIVVWVILIVAIFTGVALHPGQFNNSFNLPNTDSTRALDLMTSKFGDETNNASVQVLYSDGSTPVTDPEVAAKMAAVAGQIQALNSVTSVQGPFDYPLPEIAQQLGLVSADQTVGKINVTFNTPDTNIPASEGKLLISIVEAANTGGLSVGASGSVIANSDVGPDTSEFVGLIAAIVILLIVFGSVVAAGLPLMTALLGLGAGIGMLILAANFVDTASFAPTLAGMIGLGVGLDYSLFIMNRYRQALREGEEPKAAAHVAVATAGRAVVFAALTVVIAVSGLFVLRLSFLDGLAVGAAVTVLCVMITAVTLLPAVISLLGEKVFAGKMPWARKPVAEAERGKRFRAYAGLVERRRWFFGIGALVFMGVLAIPAFSMREGFPDAGVNPPQDTQRIAYELTAKGFGVGANGPFLVVAELPDANDLPQAQALAKAISENPQVAGVTPVEAGTPVVSKDGTAVIISVTPKTGPQSAETTALLHELRDTTIPQALAGTQVQAYVGGSTAVAEDFSTVLSSKLVLFLLVVVGLGFIVLMVLFRSLVIPLTATLTALVSFSAALGISVAVFQWGYLQSLFGIYEAGPILPFVPVMLFAILFGLSMDYQVFLVSRMQEEWGKHGDNRKAVRVGLGGSGLVVVAAATIMFCVFISFVFQSNTTIKLFGLSLAVAVALDAFVIRLMFVPALMTVLGKANWYLPTWLGKILPKVSVEG